MIYNNFQDIKLSALGLGCMRLPLTGKDSSDIDEAKATELIERSLELGINYFDTAYGYHGGKSESFVGRVLSKHNRNDYYIATKFPGYDIPSFPKFDEIFEEQLGKLQVDYFDFYLLHNLCELNINEYLSPRHNIHDKVKALKEAGKIRHIGVSSHARPETLKIFLDEYSDIIEFCQIQLNMMDWDFQNAKEAVAILNEFNIPIWVMEPLRGGSLLDRTTVEEAFHFVRSVPGVTLTLSGMSTMEQLEENAEIFSKPVQMSEELFEEIVERERMHAGKKSIPCTACNYCRAYCSMELDIPHLLSLANEFHLTEDDFVAPMAVAVLPDDKQPKACIACGNCESVCPQGIKISSELARFARELDELDEIKD